MKESEQIRHHSKEVLLFLKERYPLFHLSNVFFRDMHYGVREYLQQKGMKVGYGAAEVVAREFVKELEGQNILVAVDRQTWTLHYPEFQTPPAPKAAVPPLKPQTGDKA